MIQYDNHDSTNNHNSNNTPPGRGPDRHPVRGRGLGVGLLQVALGEPPVPAGGPRIHGRTSPLSNGAADIGHPNPAVLGETRYLKSLSSRAGRSEPGQGGRACEGA